MTDSNIGVTWRIADELVNPSMPSIALRGGAIIEGSYTAGYINSIGDGASGLEVSALAGKFFADRFAVSGEVGYRVRDEDVPSDVFVNVSGGVLLDNIGLSVNYKLVDAQSGFQINDPDFSPTARMFPRLEEDIQFLSGTVNLNVSDQTNIGRDLRGGHRRSQYVQVQSVQRDDGLFVRHLLIPPRAGALQGRFRLQSYS